MLGEHNNLQSQPYLMPPKAALESPKALYFAMLDDPDSRETAEASLAFLQQQLAQTEGMAEELPIDPQQPLTPEMLTAWVRINTEKVGQQYQRYLDDRKAGAPRRYFSSKAHALNFIKSVAPTKMVDGSWLYGVVSHWQDARFSALLRIYLEELGDGQPDKNHVVLYRKLLDTYGCEWKNLGEEYFVQGAIQQALARHADRFLPEVIGFNLGYEQLPLHLLITAYELDELNIDPYYFTLHITVDNAMTGHAHSAVNAVFEAMPQVGNRQAFLRRVMNGARLNNLGLCTLDAIAAFDLEEELIAIFAEKAVIGKLMHGNHCRIGGRTINQWLADPDGIPDLLQSLEQHQWIKRHEDPRESRFWKLIESDRAEMFGVFSPYEKQVIYDWIAGDALETLPRKDRLGAPRRMAQSGIAGKATSAGSISAMANRAHGNIIRLNPAMPGRERKRDADDFGAERALFEEQAARLQDRQELMRLLAGWLSPARHHTAIGLLATRMFCQQLAQH